MNGPVIPLTEEEEKRLLRLAREAVGHGLQTGKPLIVDPADYSAVLRVPCGVFVTLILFNELRGCVGTLEAAESLAGNVAKYAFAAAFSDARFPPLTQAEFKQTEIQISLLGPLELIPYRSETELLAQIRAGTDGLLLEDGTFRGTLLPSVWEDIPDKAEFLRRLKQKAGLPSDYWSDSIRVRRYRATCIPSEPSRPVV